MEKHAFEGLALLHDLVPFLPIDRLHGLLNNTPLPEAEEGAAVFADISGFTRLIDTLYRRLGPERGAEELNKQINTIFSGIIDAASRYRGSVIRFSGDGLTAWFTGEAAALRAAASALAMQAFARAVMAHYPLLRLKVGIGVGPTRRFLPGDPAHGVFDVLAGPAVTWMAQAEQLAQPGQIVLSPEASAAIGARFTQQPIAEGFAILSPTIFAPDDLVDPWEPLRWLDYLDRAWELVEACRPFMPAALYQRVSSGHGAYMADLRLVTPLFIRFTGLDYNAPDAAQRLHELVSVAQDRVQRYGGYLSEVGVGDKGSEMVALFGAPVALENPAQRATYAAATLLEDLPHVATLHIGITCDHLFTGTVGSPMRRAYAAVGDDVVLAARLMSLAEPGVILADYRTSTLADDFAWKALEPIRLKNKIARTRVYQWQGTARVTRPLTPRTQFVAREREISALRWALQTEHEGHARLLLMIGEAGLGKSHLLRKFDEMMSEQGITGLFGGTRSIERQIPYQIWQEILWQYFELSRQDSPQNWHAIILARLHHISPDLLSHVPLLNEIMHVGLPENEFSRSLDPAERHTALVNLLTTLLGAWLDEQPLALVLDNAQWMDSLSWDALRYVVTALEPRPLTVLLAMRPFSETRPAALEYLEQHPGTRKLVLEPLDPSDTAHLVAEILGVEEVPPAIAQLVLQKTGGNPYFIQEVVHALVDSGVIAVEAGQIALRGDPETIRLPDTVQGIVRSRIDRLPPDQQTILKVAAVLGTQFRYSTLKAVQPLRLDDDQLRACLNALKSMDLHEVESTPDDTVYAFRFALTRELAYNALSFSQRRQLHEAAARWYEAEYENDLAPYYSILAHHWRAAENPERERIYTYLAGMRAADQFANTDAVQYLSRTLAILPAKRSELRYDTLLRLEDLYHLTAARQAQQDTLTALEALARETENRDWLARVDTLWARYYASLAEYDRVLEAAQQAQEHARQANNMPLVALSLVYQGAGLMHLGRCREALAALEEAARLGDYPDIELQRATVLGTLQHRMGRYTESLSSLQAAHSIALEIGNRAAISDILAHMGDNYLVLAAYVEAADHYRRALQIRISIGNSTGEAEALAGLGMVALRRHDTEQARNYLEQARKTSAQIEDCPCEAIIMRGLGWLHFLEKDYPGAQKYLTRGVTLAENVDRSHTAILTALDLSQVHLTLGALEAAEAKLQQVEQAIAAIDPEAQVPLRFLHLPLAARLALRRGERAQAIAYSETFLSLVQERGLPTQPNPFETTLIAFTVLKGVGMQQQARDLLSAAYTLLAERAEPIAEPETRARYLLSIPAHREIIGLYERAVPRANE
ncbi:MAG: adenylate/guanylate cyclase domain-containing protein [Anaerolineae bacterium]